MKIDRKNAPGKAYRKGTSLLELFEMFPDNEAAEKWIEENRWGDSPTCPRCDSKEVSVRKNRKPMPYHCRSCRKYFSVRTGTPMATSQIPLQKWTIGIFLYITNLNGISSMKLHRDLKITQKSAWYMLHRIKEAFAAEKEVLSGAVEVDETFVGGLEGNKHASKKLKAQVIEDTKQDTLHGFIEENVEPGSTVNTDDFKGYKSFTEYDHKSVKHSVGEYVDEQAHINGIESFWAMLKRAHKGIYHKISKKHLNRYVNEFVVRHNIREEDTINQMEIIVAGMNGRRIMYKELVSGEDGRMNHLRG